MSEEVVHEDIINEDNPISEEEQIEESLTGTETENESNAIPDKYRGKSAEEIIEMHTNAERELSRLGNELGDTRKLVDKLLQAEQFPGTSQQPEPEPEVYDWDYEPEKATSTLVSKEVGAVNQKLDRLERSLQLEKFESKHGNLQEIAQSVGPEFFDWINSSPLRARAYNEGMHNRTLDNIDLSITDDLLTEWEKVSSSKSKEELESKRKADLEAASMEKGASTGGSRKKTWSRAYIRHLRMYEPAKYQAHYDEIMAAYAENRLTK